VARLAEEEALAAEELAAGRAAREAQLRLVARDASRLRRDIGIEDGQQVGRPQIGF
jgi:hypothetical protein